MRTCCLITQRGCTLDLRPPKEMYDASSGRCTSLSTWGAHAVASAGCNIGSAACGSTESMAEGGQKWKRVEYGTVATLRAEGGAGYESIVSTCKFAKRGASSARTAAGKARCLSCRKPHWNCTSRGTVNGLGCNARGAPWCPAQGRCQPRRSVCVSRQRADGKHERADGEK